MQGFLPSSAPQEEIGHDGSSILCLSSLKVNGEAGQSVDHAQQDGAWSLLALKTLGLALATPNG